MILLGALDDSDLFLIILLVWLYWQLVSDGDTPRRGHGGGR